jgi:ABC-type transport system involved in cytochrome c biogenesis permease subunit
MTLLSRLVPWGVVLVGALVLFVKMSPPDDDPNRMNLYEFSKIPVMDQGRVKPIDTMARTTMLTISNRQTFKDGEQSGQPAVKWLLDVMSSRLSEKSVALKHEVFRIDNDQLVHALGLKDKPEFWRYSINELSGKFETIQDLARQADKIPEKQRDAFNGKAMKLYHDLVTYVQLSTLEDATVIPPAEAGKPWQDFRDAAGAMQHGGAESATPEKFFAMLVAYAKNSPTDFNKAVASYRQYANEVLPEQSQKAGFEVFFNHFEPFYDATLLYIFAALLAAASWVAYTDPLRRSAFWLMVLALAVHTWALFGRMYLLNRYGVFVTNLYSSAVFIGWGCVIIGILLEVVFRIGVGAMVGSVLGALTVFVAHSLLDTGDTLANLEAVLDTNFWLATHVTVVNLGYVATFVAGFLGIAYVVLGVATPLLNRKTGEIFGDGSNVNAGLMPRAFQNMELGRVLTAMIYGILCFATLFSFTGTVLGGIWADQSWGRFWGWDPKENGALIIVLWNALILHARWGGLVKQRGVAVLAIVGNIVTAWSYFGTNQLGVGLHAYGFDDRLAVALDCFWGAQLLLIAVGSLPTRFWWSMRAPAPVRPAARARAQPA